MSVRAKLISFDQVRNQLPVYSISRQLVGMIDTPLVTEAKVQIAPGGVDGVDWLEAHLDRTVRIIDPSDLGLALFAIDHGVDSKDFDMGAGLPALRELWRGSGTLTKSSYNDRAARLLEVLRGDPMRRFVVDTWDNVPGRTEIFASLRSVSGEEVKIMPTLLLAEEEGDCQLAEALYALDHIGDELPVAKLLESREATHELWTRASSLTRDSYTKRAMKLNVLMLGKCKEKSSSYGWAKPNQIFWPSAKAHGHTKVIYWINPLHGGITREAVVRAVEMRLPLGPEPGAPSVGWFGWELAR